MPVKIINSVVDSTMKAVNNKLRWIQYSPPKAELYTVMKRWGPFSP